MVNKKTYLQSTQSSVNGFGVIGLIIVGCTSSNLSYGLDLNKEITEDLKFKSSSTRSNKKEIFSLSEIVSNKRTLDNIKKLETGWNGYGSEKIDVKLIDTVSNLITGLERQPKIFPTGRGTIQIEFSNDENYLEIEISNSVSFYFEQKNTQEFEGEISLDNINKKVNDFFA